MPVLVRDLIDGRPSPVTINSNAGLADAYRLMDEHDFTQLPVTGKDERLVGLITAESMLRALTTFAQPIGELRVHDAVLPVRPFEVDGDLFQLLERLANEFAVVVVDQNSVVGIVTAFDTSSYFRKRAEDIMIVEDIERTLRDFILLAFPEPEAGGENKPLHEAVQKALAPPYGFDAYKRSLGTFCRECGESKPKVTPEAATKAFEVFVSKSSTDKSFDDLTMSETVNIFLSADRWQTYAEVIPLKVEAIRSMLDAVREIRNKLAHFKGEVTGAEHQRLIQCRNWLDSYREDLYRLLRPEERAEDESEEIEGAELPSSPSEDSRVPSEGADKVRAPRSKYSNLHRWLLGVPSERSYTWIGFDRIEEMIGEPLPPSARSTTNWWANDSTSRVQSRQWLSAGFRVDGVDLDAQQVRFRRIETRPKAVGVLPPMTFEELFNLYFKNGGEKPAELKPRDDTEGKR